MDVVTHGLSGAVVGAAFGTVFPDHSVELTVLGVLAGMLPDLDFLAELKGKEAAWKLHRIVLHGIVPSFALGCLLVLLASWVIPLGAWWLAAVVYSSISVHLFLDVLTSFGTCLFYPFSKFRVSFKSHFIVDPIVLAICLYALLTAAPVSGLVMLAGYVVVSWILKAVALVYVTTRVPDALRGNPITLEPALLAPFRWLVIVKTSEGYAFAGFNFFWLTPWHQVNKGDEQLVPLAMKSGLLAAVLATFEFPVFRRVHVNGESLFLLEDVKWWTERPFRPLAFKALITADHDQQLVLQDIQQGGFFVRESVTHHYLQPPERFI